MKKICQHLLPILILEKSLGNSEKEEIEDGWEGIELDILLKRSLHLAEIKNQISFPVFVTEWESKDLHYSVNGEHGFLCKNCKQNIKGPI